MNDEAAMDRIEGKLDKLNDRLGDFGLKLTELAVRSELVGILEQRIAKQEERLKLLEDFKLKLAGIAIALGLLTGAGSAAGMHFYLTPPPAIARAVEASIGKAP